MTLFLLPVDGLADAARLEHADSEDIATSSSSVNLSNSSFSSRLRVDLGAFYSSPGALNKGMVSGALVSSALPITSWVNLGIQISAGQVEASNLTYKLEHMELHGLFTLEPSLSLGRAQLGLVLGAGVLVLNEQRSRHGAMRIAAAGLEPTTSVWTSGPAMRIGPRLRLNIVHRFDALLQTDLTYSFTTVDDEFQGRRGWSGLLALGYRL